MGKKKKAVEVQEEKLDVFCFYCDRRFDDEKVLIQHQKAKHFKCEMCGKKLSTAGGLVVHVQQVHKQTITKIPNALSDRDNIEVEVYGMEGIPDEYLSEKHKRLKYSQPISGAPIPPGLPFNPGYARPPTGYRYPPTYQPGYPQPAPYAAGYPPVPPGPPQSMPPSAGLPPLPPHAGMPPPPSMSMAAPPPPPPPMSTAPPPLPMGVPPPPPPAMSAAQPQPPLPTAAAPVPADVRLLYEPVDDISMEERRAQLPAYRYDESKMKEQLSQLDQSIEQRFSQILS